ncbi:MAG TPA: hypothetical protein VIJ94_05120 [Caulobacteraceae bacterium]
MPQLPSLDEARRALADTPEFTSEFCALVKKFDLDRFVGIALIHAHDNCDVGTVLVESAAGQNELKITAIPASEAPLDATVSVWRIEGDQLTAIQFCGGCHDSSDIR